MCPCLPVPVPWARGWAGSFWLLKGSIFVILSSGGAGTENRRGRGGGQRRLQGTATPPRVQPCPGSNPAEGTFPLGPSSAGSRSSAAPEPLRTCPELAPGAPGKRGRRECRRTSSTPWVEPGRGAPGATGFLWLPVSPVRQTELFQTNWLSPALLVPLIPWD